MTDNCPRSCGRCGMKHNLKFMKYEPGAPCEDLDSHECANIQPEQCINFP